MIGIKGMQMPKGCKNCLIGCNDYTDLIAFQKKNPEDYCNQRLKTCRIVDLGSEDMSWEKLKEKAKSFIEKIDKTIERRNVEYFEIDICGLSFWEDGIVLDEHNDIILTNKTPFEMWQIINALTGEHK